MKAFLAFLLFLASLASETTKTVVSFSRKINTCDPQDRPLTEGISKVVWSYSNTLPSNENTIQRHDERGVQSVRFFAQPDVPLPPDAEYFEIKGNNIPIAFDNPRLGPTTNYWCTAYKVELGAKKHVIRIDPVIDPRNIKQVHHILVYSCQGELNDTELAWSQGCYWSNMPPNLLNCNGQVLVAAWAIGGGPYTFPDTVGLPIGPNTTYLLMEIHYDNPTQVQIEDSSGVRFYYVDPTREYEGAVFSVGHFTNPIFSIPPQRSSYAVDVFIPSDCTREMIPPEGIHLLAGTLHTHTAGIAVNFTIIRDGQAFSPLLAEPYYDFNFQEFTEISPEFVLLPGDEMHLVCEYNTQYRDQPTYFGLSTLEEMCVVYLVYYPRAADGVLQAYYGDYTGISPNNKTVSCDGQTMTNLNLTMQYTPYIPPVCNMSTPSLEMSTARIRNERIDADYYEKSQYLDEDEKYKLYWTVDRDNAVFHAAVEVETNGWVGLGISEAGMQGADVFIAWARDGVANFADRFATQKALPGQDASQDYYSITVGTYTPSDSGFSTQAIALIGGVVGASLVILVALIVFCIRRRRKAQNQEYTDLLEENDAGKQTGKHSLPLR